MTSHGRAHNTGPTKLAVLVSSPLAAQLLPGFVPKRSLKLNLRKTVCSSIAIGRVQQGQSGIAEQFARLMQPSGGEAAASGDVAAGGSGEAAVSSHLREGWIWLQSKVSLKGMPIG